MQKFNESDLEENRIGNNATDKEWEIIKDFLCEGHIFNLDSAKICYQNIKENKKWYYKLNAIVNDSNLIETKMIVGLIVAAIAFGVYPGIIDDIVAPLIGYNYSHLFYSIPDTLNAILRVATMLVAVLAQAKVINKLSYEKDIDQLQRNLKKAIAPGEKTSIKDKILNFFTKRAKEKSKISNQSLVDYVNKELAERGTNQDEEIIKKQNEEHASAFVKMIGDDIKSIFANPYPNCQKELDALQQLSHYYVEYMIKENEAKEAGKINLRLTSGNNFYTRLSNLEARIKDNMKINKLREYNKGYIDDIVKDASKAVEQNNQPIYTGPVVNGHIPTVEEQFYAEAQNYDTTDTEDKGRGRVLSPNNK